MRNYQLSISLKTISGGVSFEGFDNIVLMLSLCVWEGGWTGCVQVFSLLFFSLVHVVGVACYYMIRDYNIFSIVPGQLINPLRCIFRRKLSSSVNFKTELNRRTQNPALN